MLSHYWSVCLCISIQTPPPFFTRNFTLKSICVYVIHSHLNLLCSYVVELEYVVCNAKQAGLTTFSVIIAIFLKPRFIHPKIHLVSKLFNIQCWFLESSSINPINIWTNITPHPDWNAHNLQFNVFFFSLILLSSPNLLKTPPVRIKTICVFYLRMQMNGFVYQFLYLILKNTILSIQ